jgi:hypothetical protein
VSWPNTPVGRAGVVAFFRAHGVVRVGVEASGGYEIEIVWGEGSPGATGSAKLRQGVLPHESHSLR